ncbi:hypothetical protein MKC76_19960 [[Clostridium] innocuum]|nr:hypothetical protein [[Clostridium] innocuum]MCR0411853.1 hypothetical protein [[Clostridium] innocuum]MCR0447040.1 hypothetical protein [[Clostridium] innocuum]
MEIYINLTTAIITLITALCAAYTARNEKTTKTEMPSIKQIMKNGNISTSGNDSPVIINQKNICPTMNKAQRIRDSETLKRASKKRSKTKSKYIDATSLLLPLLLFILFWMNEYPAADYTIDDPFRDFLGRVLHTILLVMIQGIKIAFYISIILLLFEIKRVSRDIKCKKVKAFSYINLLWILAVITQSIILYCMASNQIANDVIIMLLLFIVSRYDCMQLIHLYFIRSRFEQSVIQYWRIILFFIIILIFLLLQDSILPFIPRYKIPVSFV